MKNQKQTIRKIVAMLNNPEEDGGFWLPNIQRPFVWSESQICRLFDSILRQYPISTLLVWKTKADIGYRQFIMAWKDELGDQLSLFALPNDTKKKNLVLDGQQRLQSLYIGLRGTYEGRELYFDVQSGEVAAPDDVKYRFRFASAADGLEFPWVKFKQLIDSNDYPQATVDKLTTHVRSKLSTGDIEKIGKHIWLVDKTFKNDEAITYQELDSIDNPDLYEPDDVVEIFIRANSGGTKLGKSDLLFSLLQADWDDAGPRMESLIASLNKHGFAFDRDFVLKSALTLLDQGSRYEVSKFRKEGVRDQVEEKWTAIAGAIQEVLDFVRGKTFIQQDKALPTYLVLIPLIYLRYHKPAAWKAAKELDHYLLRCSLAGAFSGNSDNLIDALVRQLRDVDDFNLDETFDVVRRQGRSLELTVERLWTLGYGSDSIHLLFNLWYRDFNHTPAYANNLPEVDHIFPQSALKKVKIVNPATGRKDTMKYRDADRNQLANCMLLSKEENGSGGKSDTLPEIWFGDKTPEYLDKHLIPNDPALWQLDRFEDFIAARKALIRAKFGYLLVLRREARG